AAAIAQIGADDAAIHESLGAVVGHGIDHRRIAMLEPVREIYPGLRRVEALLRGIGGVNDDDFPIRGGEGSLNGERGRGGAEHKGRGQKGEFFHDNPPEPETLRDELYSRSCPKRNVYNVRKSKVIPSKAGSTPSGNSRFRDS